MYECPSCGGGLTFDIPSQQLRCTYCTSLFDPYSIQKEKDAIEAVDYEVTVFTCPQCGGELISEDNTVSSFCSFCGSSNILTSRISRERRPAYIIPFKKTKKDCTTAYKEMVNKALFAPDKFKANSTVEQFRGIYMPYYIYTLEKKGNIILHGMKSKQQGDYLYKDHYNMSSEMDVHYDGVSYDGSASFSDHISSCIAPFVWKDHQNFTPSFLSGFYADTSDVSSHVYDDDAIDLTKRASAHALTSNRIYSQYGVHSYDDLVQKKVTAPITDTKLAMFPVWFLATRQGNRVSYAVVNGQTGKVVSDLPIDSRKYILASLLMALPIWGILNLVLSIKATTLLILAIILTCIFGLINYVQAKQLSKRKFFMDDRGLNSYWELKSMEEKIKSGNYSAEDTFGSPKRKKSNTKMNVNIPMPENWASVRVKPIAACLLGILIFIIHPVWDGFYYIATAIMGICMILSVLDMIKYHNELSMRPLPQFKRTGGNDYEE